MKFDDLKVVYPLPPEQDYCDDCWKKAAIKCAWCKHTILPGDPITLYIPTREDYEVPKHATVYKTEPLQIVGCLRESCAKSGIERGGLWVMPGKVQPMPTVMEMLIAQCKKGIDDPITSDLSNQRGAAALTELHFKNHKYPET